MEQLPEVRETRTGSYGVCLDRGKLLVIRKAKGPYRGQFDLPGGGIEFGETPEQAVVREFGEEAGVTVRVDAILGAFSKVSRWVGDLGDRRIEGHHMGFLYRVTADLAQPIKSDADGLDSLGALWAPLSDLNPITASPLVMRALELMKEEA